MQTNTNMTRSKKPSVAIGQDYYQQQLRKKQQQAAAAIAAAAAGAVVQPVAAVQTLRRSKPASTPTRRAPRPSTANTSTVKVVQDKHKHDDYDDIHSTHTTDSKNATTPSSSRASKLRKVGRSPLSEAQLLPLIVTTTTAAPSVQPQVRSVDETTIVAVPTAVAARPIHSLPLPPNDNDPRLRRAQATGLRLEFIPEESQEETSVDHNNNDKVEEQEDVSFFDAIPEHSPTIAAPQRTSERRSIARGIMVVATPVVLAVALAALFSPDVFIQSWHKFWPSIGSGSIHDGPPCFEDFPTATAVDVAPEENLPAHCLAQSSRTACPPHAICRAGVMVGCLDSRHWEINGTACVLTPQSQDTVRATHALLEKYSVHVVCSGGRHHKVKHPLFAQYDDQYGGVPLFRYRPLAKAYLQTTYDPHLLELANEEDLTFVLRRAGGDHDNDDILVGLHPCHRLDIPLRCTLQNYFAMVTQVIGAVILDVLGILDSYLWGSLVTAAPLLLQTVVLVGGGSLVLWWMMIEIRRRNRAKRQRDFDIGNLRHAALLQLEQHQGSYVASSHLCEALLWELFPRNKAKRERRKQQLWPCVVTDLRSDSRVKCFYDGPELMLQWH